MTRAVNVLLFDDVEVLDFAGPFEVFGVAGKRDGPGFFTVHTVGENGTVIRARNELIVTPTYSFANAPPCDVLVVPGGYGTRREMHNDAVLEWVCRQATRAELVLSVCTGALLLGRAGLLDGLEATTHQGALDLLATSAPNTRVHRDQRIVDNGKVVTSAGVSAGIDAALHIVSRLHGADAARETARYMEYDGNFGV
jgi:transcriptional regulator GlxA family with amidase domain